MSANDKTKEKTSQRARVWVAFLLVQVVVVSAALAATRFRMRELEAPKAMPTFRDVPLEITPLYDDPRVVTDEQLDTVLHKLRPRLRGPKPKINHVDHAMRFWGVDAKFDDPECLSGAEMREVLLDHRKFAQLWGEHQRSLLFLNPKGIGVRTREGLATASHDDHTLASLAECGTPLDYPIRTPDEDATVRALLEQSLRRFSINQIEYEWSTLAYALYLPPTRQFVTYENQVVTFDLLADRIMRQKLGQGVCLGNHRLHTLVVLLRVDDEYDILTPAGRDRIIAYLQDVTARFVAHQKPEGYWNRSWPDGAHVPEADDTLAYKVLATGHVLEWWALAPEELHPPRETIVRAGQWLATTVGGMDEAKIKDDYTFLSHVGRALALWRGHFPVYFLERRQADASDQT